MRCCSDCAALLTQLTAICLLVGTTAGEETRWPDGERVRVDELPMLKQAWTDYDEWDADYEWQVDSEGVVLEIDEADGTALVNFDIE